MKDVSEDTLERVRAGQPLRVAIPAAVGDTLSTVKETARRLLGSFARDVDWLGAVPHGQGTEVVQGRSPEEVKQAFDDALGRVIERVLDHYQEV
jgi:hypothetical protein